MERLKRREKAISIMLLVGGFSESEYLQNGVEQEFLSEVSNISIPTRLIASVMKGGK